MTGSNAGRVAQIYTLLELDGVWGAIAFKWEVDFIAVVVPEEASSVCCTTLEVCL